MRLGYEMDIGPDCDSITFSVRNFYLSPSVFILIFVVLFYFDMKWKLFRRCSAITTWLESRKRGCSSQDDSKKNQINNSAAKPSFGIFLRKQATPADTICYSGPEVKSIYFLMENYLKTTLDIPFFIIFFFPLVEIGQSSTGWHNEKLWYCFIKSKCRSPAYSYTWWTWLIFSTKHFYRIELKPILQWNDDSTRSQCKATFSTSYSISPSLSSLD